MLQASNIIKSNGIAALHYICETNANNSASHHKQTLEQKGLKIMISATPSFLLLGIYTTCMLEEHTSATIDEICLVLSNKALLAANLNACLANLSLTSEFSLSTLLQLVIAHALWAESLLWSTCFARSDSHHLNHELVPAHTSNWRIEEDETSPSSHQGVRFLFLHP